MNTKYIFTVGFFLLVSLSSFGQNCNKGEQRTKEEIEREKRDREWWEAGNHAMCTRVANGRDKSYGESFQTVYERCMKRFHYDNTHPKHKDIPIQGSKDPNELTGINGWMEITAASDTIRWVSPTQELSYTVYFENDPYQALAAAQVVTIHVPIDSLMDPNTLAVGGFGFATKVFPVDGSPMRYQQRLDLRDEMNLYVDILAGYDVTTNEAIWIFSSIDPETGVAPTEVNRGFLAINDPETHVGEGFVTFSIKPKKDLCHTGDTIVVDATIVFDQNEAIPTNRWKNTVDAGIPQGTMQLLEETADSLFFTFGGTDDATGIAYHRLYYTVNNGANRLAGIYEFGTRAAFAKTPNTLYSFFALAEDNVGNIESPGDVSSIQYGSQNVDVAVTILPEGTATVTGTGSIEAGTSVTLTATPATGYRFKRWLQAGVPQGTESTLNITPTESVTITAEMEAIPYDLTVSSATGTSITTQAFTLSRNNAVSNPSTISHFDSLAISFASEHCYHDIHFFMGSEELLRDTIVEVTGPIVLSSTATADAVGNSVVKDTTCPNLPYTANGFNLLATSTAASGEFSRTLTNDAGCDSTVTLQLHIKTTHTLTFLANGGSGIMATQTVCDGENVVLNNSTFSNEGFFSGWATSAGGTVEYSDGAVINTDRDLTLYAVWSSIGCVDRVYSRIESLCDSITWRDSTYRLSGIYYDTVKNAVPGGCDSIYSLHLSLRYSSDSVMNIVSSQPYTWVDNQTYNSNTERILSFTNAANCDSTLTLHLTVNYTTTGDTIIYVRLGVVGDSIFSKEDQTMVVVNPAVTHVKIGFRVEPTAERIELYDMEEHLIGTFYDSAEPTQIYRLKSGSYIVRAVYSEGKFFQQTVNFENVIHY